MASSRASTCSSRYPRRCIRNAAARTCSTVINCPRSRKAASLSMTISTSSTRYPYVSIDVRSKRCFAGRDKWRRISSADSRALSTQTRAPLATHRCVALTHRECVFDAPERPVNVCDGVSVFNERKRHLTDCLRRHNGCALTAFERRPGLREKGVDRARLVALVAPRGVRKDGSSHYVPTKGVNQ